MSKTQINMAPSVKQRLKEYGKESGMTMTTIIHLAIDKYFEHLTLAEKIKQVFNEALDAQNSKSKT